MVIHEKVTPLLASELLAVNCVVLEVPTTTNAAVVAALLILVS